ncbi:MAG: hypothetical protein K1Y36_28040 [Blastocatellia bacterium]|nr:hypothetical protein [Blastocatellia bacterium]
MNEPFAYPSQTPHGRPVSHTPKYRRRNPKMAVLAGLLIFVQIVTCTPVQVWAALKPETNNGKTPPPAPAVKVNRTVPPAEPEPTGPRFSTPPTDKEITRFRIFEEPLVRNLNAKPAKAEVSLTQRENQDLAVAMQMYQEKNDPEAVEPLVAFLKKHPHSEWNDSLLINLGLVYRRTGYFLKALDAWETAWKNSKTSTDPTMSAIADRALGELAQLHARLGHQQRMTELVKEHDSRNIRSSANEKFSYAKQGLRLMQNRPDKAFKCGPYALDSIRMMLNPKDANNPIIDAFCSTAKGTSLAQVAGLAKELGMEFQLAKREPGAPVVTPAVIHWKAGHFAALFEPSAQPAAMKYRYRVEDPTFGTEMFISQAALDSELSGYALIPAGKLPEGWQPVTEAEAKTIWGKGACENIDPDNYFCPNDTTNPPGCKTCGNPPSPGMAGYKFFTSLVSLNLTDTPVGYRPPVGPGVFATVTYNQREIHQPQVPPYFNLGPKWTLDWLSYVVENDMNPATSSVYLYPSGGGQMTFGYNPGTGGYNVEPYTQAVLRKVTTPSVHYEVEKPDGSIDVYGKFLLFSSPAKYFLTERIDPTGNKLTFTYSGGQDSNLHLTAVTDAIGQVTTVTYVGGASNQISQITDPFGRSAIFAYNKSGELASITDVIGLTSEFGYSIKDFVAKLITPYKTTTFDTEDIHTPAPAHMSDRWLTATDLEGIERLESAYDIQTVYPQFPTAAPTEQVPQNMTLSNGNLQYRNSFFWDKKMWQEVLSQTPPNQQPDPAVKYSKAKITHFLHKNIGVASGFIESMKMPLEGRVWYFYGQNNPIYQESAMMRPTQIGRTVNDGNFVVSQVYNYTYNSVGKVLTATDPLGEASSPTNPLKPGRVMRYTYAANNQDLIKVEQRRVVNQQLVWDTLAQYTYNSKHQPLTMTDAASQTTAFTYTANQYSQRQTVTNAKSETTTFAYSAVNGSPSVFLTSVTGPVSGSTTTYGYDGYNRVRTVTNSDSYTVTTDYDNGDRPTVITYPDGTTQEMGYTKLDLTTVQDRLRRVTTSVFDEQRRVISVTDPQQRTTQFTWCLCGQLATMTDARNQTTTWERDTQGRVTRKILHGGSTTTYGYEQLTSRLGRMIDAKSQNTDYSYNVDNTLRQTAYTNTTVATPTVSFLYDQEYNRVASMTDGIGTTTYSYKPAGMQGALQPATMDGPFLNDTVTYSYDQLGRTLNRTINGVAATMDYDQLGRITFMTNALGTFTPSYDGVTGRVLQMQAVNPSAQTVFTSNFQYFGNTDDRRLQQIKHQTAGSSILSQFDFTYLLESQMATLTRNLPGTTNPTTTYTFSYDGADQLTGASLASGGTSLSDAAYAYDPAGNRTDETINGVPRVSNYNATNQMLDVVDEKFFTYDNNGNCTKEEDFARNTLRTFEWDAANRLLAVNVTAGNKRSEFSYDGLSRRAKIVEKVNGAVTSSRFYLWCGGEICEERSGTSGDTVTKRYFPQGVQAGGTPYYYTRDHLGSIREGLDQTGTVVARYDYDAWGRQTKLSGSLDADFGYAGYWNHKPSGLNLTWYRAYDPNLARWLSRDPLGEMGGINQYDYVMNEPTFKTDPTGLIPGNPAVPPSRMPTHGRPCGAGGSCPDPYPGWWPSWPSDWNGKICRGICWAVPTVICVIVGGTCTWGTVVTIGGLAIPCSWITVTVCATTMFGGSICADKCTDVFDPPKPCPTK